jgi:hypothetical protein
LPKKENSMTNNLTNRIRISEIVAEYDDKRANLSAALEKFKGAGDALQSAASIRGTYGQEHINVGSVWERTLEKNLLKSAWLHVYAGLDIDKIASAKDKNLFKQTLESPPEFTLDNIRASFGDYLLNPRDNILRGLAEAFCRLDDAYKSHEKVKIGVSGLPKRIILSNVGRWGWGHDYLKDILDALARYQGKPLVSHIEMDALLKDENAMMQDLICDKTGAVLVPARGVWLRRFKNGNGHLFFGTEALRDINLALAEYYGDVLPDAASPKAARERTDVAKDLQYYPTPEKVVQSIMHDMPALIGKKVLEPSCGCGRFMDALAKSECADVTGVEYDAGRVQVAREKGHSVIHGNFLELEPVAMYDYVIMNPPFYGKHYVKHVRHALRFLKPGGCLKAILPATARYDHNLLRGRWSDLPVGSFAESGTNINTVVLTICM